MKKHANNLTFELVFSPSGHAFIRKWMLLSDPGDKEAEDEEAVSVHAQLNNLINNKVNFLLNKFHSFFSWC